MVNNIKAECDDPMVISSSNTVLNEAAVVFKKGKAIVGTMKARYDFSDVPADLQSIALGIVSNSQVVYVNID